VRQPTGTDRPSKTLTSLIAERYEKKTDSSILSLGVDPAPRPSAGLRHSDRRWCDHTDRRSALPADCPGVGLPVEPAFGPADRRWRHRGRAPGGDGRPPAIESTPVGRCLNGCRRAAHAATGQGRVVPNLLITGSSHGIRQPPKARRGRIQFCWSSAAAEKGLRHPDVWPRLPFSIRNQRWLPLRRCHLPTLLALTGPELEGLIAAELQPPFEQRHRLIRKQLPHGDLQSLGPAIPPGRPEVEDLATIADPALLGREGRPLAVAGDRGWLMPTQVPSPVASPCRPSSPDIGR